MILNAAFPFVADRILPDGDLPAEFKWHERQMPAVFACYTTCRNFFPAGVHKTGAEQQKNNGIVRLDRTEAPGGRTPAR